MKSLTLVFACLVFLFGCTGAAKKAPETRPDTAAREYLERGDYAAAAREYQRLADSRPDEAVSYRLSAVDAHLEANDLDKASELLERIKVPADNEPLRLRLQLLRSRLALYRDQPQRALTLSPAALPDNTSPALLADYHRTRALAFEMQGEATAAVRERHRLHQHLESTENRRDNTRRIWANMKKLDQAELQRLASEGSTDLSGWVELALIYERLLSEPESFRQAIEAWRRRMEDHPAIPDITSELLAASRDIQSKPGAIALLLPLSGPYQRASEAIRDGFLAAWYAAQDYQPSIRIYDSDSLNILDDYRQAVEDGAELIVGPLEKAAIRALIQSGRVAIPTLALNQIDHGDAAPDQAGIETLEDDHHLYQFGLSPEHEVRQLVHRGIFEGFNRSLVIMPDNQWGKRLTTTFTKEWQGLGGTLLEVVSYDPNSQGFISPVKRLLNIDSSEARIRRLRQKLSRNIKAESRRRQDADFIYMAAVPVNARQLIPQFRFFRVNKTPIYSTSHVYSGTRDPQLDSDMNGVEFTEIPWVLRPADKQSAIQKHIEANWSSRSSNYQRLYAFGVDAFQIIPHLGQLSLLDRYRFEGETGELSMTDDGYIHRRLKWARFINGRPVPLEIGNHFEQGTDISSQR